MYIFASMAINVTLTCFFSLIILCFSFINDPQCFILHHSFFFLKIVMKVLTRSYCLLPCKSSVAYTGVLHEVLLALARVFSGMSGTDLSLHSDATLLASGPAGGSVMFMKLVAASGSLWTMPADDLCREHWQPAKTNDKPNFTDFHVSFAYKSI